MAFGKAKGNKKKVREAPPSDAEVESDEEADSNKKKKGKSKAPKSKEARKERRSAEDTEIAQLEARIKAEAPAVGRGNFGADKAQAQAKGDGPALTGEYFKDLPISKRTLKALKTHHFERMTEIQRGSIIRALAGRDILGEARTGSGKTLAFLVPTLELLFRRKWNHMDGLGALIISPTKELAYQIFSVVKLVGDQHDYSAGCIVGGRSIEEEQKSIVKMSILVATPGRLLQHLDESPYFEVSQLQMLVLDEADRILDFGFQETVHHILGHLPTDRQTQLFSATLRASVQKLGRAALRSPEIVSVHSDAAGRTPEKLKQVFMTCPVQEKVNNLFSFLRTHSQKKIIVFVSACKQVRFLYEAFKVLKPGPAMMELHGRQSLTKRLVVFQEFKERERAVALISTDVAARGVDFPAVDWVVQMDCPESIDSYIHRVGRTARYQSSGHSVLFLTPSEKAFAGKLAAQQIDVKSISAKHGSVMDIKGKLMSLLAGNQAIRHLATKAFTSYVRSVALMKEKDVFDAKSIPLTELAESFGLPMAPEVGNLGDVADEDVEHNPQKRQKNLTPLQRLREKIKQKKEEKRQKQAKGEAISESDDEAEMQNDKKKPKLGRWERRQQRLKKAAEGAAKRREGEEDALAKGAELGSASTAAAKSNDKDDDDDLLELVDPSQETKPLAGPAPTAAQRQKLKLSRDGTAANAHGKHTFFGAGKAGGELAALAEELGGEAFTINGGSSSSTSSAKKGKKRSAKELEESEPPAKIDMADRKAFLASVARDLQHRDREDAVASRARVKEAHREKRFKGREDFRDDEGRAVVRLGSASDDEDGDAAGPDDGSESDSSPRVYVPRPKGAAAPKTSKAPPATAADDLEALEREALGKLAGSGLFG